jgi:hypothetical protein
MYVAGGAIDRGTDDALGKRFVHTLAYETFSTDTWTGHLFTI